MDVVNSDGDEGETGKEAESKGVISVPREKGGERESKIALF